MTVSTGLSKLWRHFDLKMIATWISSQHQLLFRSSVFFTKWFNADIGLLHYVGLENSQITFAIWFGHASERVLVWGVTQFCFKFLLKNLFAIWPWASYLVSLSVPHMLEDTIEPEPWVLKNIYTTERLYIYIVYI